MLFISSKTSSSQRILGLPIGLLDMGFHLLIFCTLLSSAMRSTWPNQFSLCFLINPIIFCPFNMSLISWLVWWLHLLPQKILKQLHWEGGLMKFCGSHNTEHKLCSQVDSVPASYLWDLGFKSQTRDHQSWLKFLSIFLLYLFAYGLLYDAVSISNLVVECLVSNKLEKMQKETVIT